MPLARGEAPTSPRSDDARLTIKTLGSAGGDVSFADDVRAGLSADPKWLKPKYLYDPLGSHLFDAICLLPEYYLTRAESEILRTAAPEIVGSLGDRVRLLELGSGSSVKTRHLLEAALEAQGSLHYLPVDISHSALERSARELLQIYPGLEVIGYAADYSRALAGIFEENSQKRPDERTLALFLGSTIGNLSPDEQRELLREMRRALSDGDGLLLGTDLRKDPALLEAAYDDSLGVTAAFNRNHLGRINRELGGEFDPRSFSYRAQFSDERSRVEMFLTSRRTQTVPIRDLELEVAFAEGEAMHTESSHKFDAEQIAALALDTGFHLERTWLDSGERFSLNLLVADPENGRG